MDTTADSTINEASRDDCDNPLEVICSEMSKRLDSNDSFSFGIEIWVEFDGGDKDVDVAAAVVVVVLIDEAVIRSSLLLFDWSLPLAVIDWESHRCAAAAPPTNDDDDDLNEWYSKWSVCLGGSSI